MTLLLRIAIAVTLLVAPAARADLLRIIEEPGDAGQVRADLIQQATTDVSAMYFIVRHDRVTLGSLALLRDARRRGVASVRLLTDANFTRIPKPLLAHLRDEGVQIRVYHPIDLRHPSWLLRRMHEKLMVVDGRRYVTGGRNLAEPYFGLAKRNYLDRDVYVDGPSAVHAMEHFDAVWASRHVVDLDVHVSGAETEQASRDLDTVMTGLRGGTGVVTLDTARDWSDGAVEVGDVRFIHDPVGRRGVRVGNQLSEIMEKAESSIVIESPYLVPSRAVRRLLKNKLREGVRVVIVTNSIHSTDAVFPHAAYVKYRRGLLRAGFELYEYKGPDMLHAKSFVIDERIFGVGSYNLDPRSQNLNTEVICLADNEEMARELLALIDTHIENSWKVGEPREGEKRVSRGRVLYGWVARILVLVPVLENQL